MLLLLCVVLYLISFSIFNTGLTLQTNQLTRQQGILPVLLMATHTLATLFAECINKLLFNQTLACVQCNCLDATVFGLLTSQIPNIYKIA